MTLWKENSQGPSNQPQPPNSFRGLRALCWNFQAEWQEGFKFYTQSVQNSRRRKWMKKTQWSFGFILMLFNGWLFCPFIAFHYILLFYWLSNTNKSDFFIPKLNLWIYWYVFSRRIFMWRSICWLGVTIKIDLQTGTFEMAGGAAINIPWSWSWTQCPIPNQGLLQILTVVGGSISST